MFDKETKSLENYIYCYINNQIDSDDGKKNGNCLVPNLCRVLGNVDQTLPTLPMVFARSSSSAVLVTLHLVRHLDGHGYLAKYLHLFLLFMNLDLGLDLVGHLHVQRLVMFGIAFARLGDVVAVVVVVRRRPPGDEKK